MPQYRLQSYAGPCVTPGALMPVAPANAASSLHLADAAHRVFDALGVGVPERLELGLIEIGNVLAEIFHGLLEFVVRRGLFRNITHRRDDRSRRALGREQADPEIEFD